MSNQCTWRVTFHADGFPRARLITIVDVQGSRLVVPSDEGFKQVQPLPLSPDFSWQSSNKAFSGSTRPHFVIISNFTPLTVRARFPNTTWRINRPLNSLIQAYQHQGVSYDGLYGLYSRYMGRNVLLWVNNGSRRARALLGCPLIVPCLSRPLSSCKGPGYEQHDYPAPLLGGMVIASVSCTSCS